MKLQSLLEFAINSAIAESLNRFYPPSLSFCRSAWLFTERSLLHITPLTADWLQVCFGTRYLHSNQIKSNQIKSLLLSHHHSTSALVSEILMSVLQTVQKNNRQFTYGQTVQKKQQTVYLWTDSAKKTANNLPMDRQCKKNNNKQFTYGQTVQKKTTTNNLHMDRQCKKTANNLHMDRQCKKTTNNLHMDRQCKKKQQLQFTYGQTVQKNNSNLHMDSTYLQTVQKTMCKIHIHILSTLSVL